MLELFIVGFVYLFKVAVGLALLIVPFSIAWFSMKHTQYEQKLHESAGVKPQPGYIR